MDFDNLIPELTKEILTKLEILKEKYKKMLEEEVLNTVYAYPASGLYQRTMATLNSITAKIRVENNFIILELFFDPNILNEKHYSVVSGSNIYNGKNIFIPPLLDEGHIQKLWNREDYPAMNFIKNTIEKIKEDLYKELNNFIGITIEKVGGKEFY